jgi:hypothetical protein
MTERDFLMVGDKVDLVIGSQFLPNQRGNPIELDGRHDGELVAWNHQYGTAEVKWPDGAQHSYEPALLRRR